MRRGEASAREPGVGARPQRTGRGPASQPAGFVLYSRRRCHLCDEMLAALRAQLGMAAPITVIDVDSDPALEARYGENVPVLMYDQTEVCRHRHNAEKVAAYLAHSR
jgi:Glutaredoxin-like domain (DUF836)